MKKVIGTIRMQDLQNLRPRVRITEEMLMEGVREMVRRLAPDAVGFTVTTLPADKGIEIEVDLPDPQPQALLP